MSTTKATARTGADPVPDIDRRSAVEADQVASIAVASEPGFALVRLNDLTIQAITEAGLELTHRPVHRVIGHSIAELVDQRDQQSVLTAFAALRQGSIDSFRAHGLGAPANRRRRAFVAWVRSVELGGVNYALTMWVSPPDGRHWPTGLASLTERLVAVAITDRAGTVTSAFINPDESPGLTDDDLVNLPVPRAGVADDLRDLPVSITTSGGERMALRAIVAPLAGSAGRLVGLLAPPSPTAREVELESHLWRIAAEVESSGILVRAGPVPRLALARGFDGPDLTPRQWEVLRRLLNGQRVPTIATELFVAQSTVRNHLAAIFERFGVHSQPELLALLAQPNTLPINTDGSSIA